MTYEPLSYDELHLIRNLLKQRMSALSDDPDSEAYLLAERTLGVMTHVEDVVAVKDC